MWKRWNVRDSDRPAAVGPVCVGLKLPEEGDGWQDAWNEAWKSDSPADEVLQHRALPRTLAAHHRDLRQVQVRVLADGGESILHAIHHRNQVLHAPVAHLGGAVEKAVCRRGSSALLSSRPALRSRVQGAFCAAGRCSVRCFIHCSSSVCRITLHQRSRTLLSTEHRRGGGEQDEDDLLDFLRGDPCSFHSHHAVETLVHFLFSACRNVLIMLECHVAEAFRSS